MTFDEVRASFPVLERIAYLNAGSMGPLARATVEAMASRALADLERGRGGPEYTEAMHALRADVRQRLAGLVSVPAENLALTYSTSNACQIVFAGLDLGDGAEVVTTDTEHFGLLGPLHASGATVHVARVRDKAPGDAFEEIASAVTRRTRLLALSHVSWMTGHRFPVLELKQALGLPVLVDGAQSVGAVEVDASAFDFYTISGQKWLCGPDATGGLYIADPERLRIGAPNNFSQEAYEPEGSFEPRAGAARFDAGWLPLPSLAGLRTAIDSAPSWRFERGAATTRLCGSLLEQEAPVITEPGHSTLVSFAVDGDAKAVAEQAYEAGVVVRDIPGTPWIRVSCGYWTSEDDLERLLTLIKSARPVV